MSHIIGIDIGGTGIEVGPVDPDTGARTAAGRSAATLVPNAEHGQLVFGGADLEESVSGRATHGGGST